MYMHGLPYEKLEGKYGQYVVLCSGDYLMLGIYICMSKQLIKNTFIRPAVISPLP